jgi:hypothetical protein
VLSLEALERAKLTIVLLFELFAQLFQCHQIAVIFGRKDQGIEVGSLVIERRFKRLTRDQSVWQTAKKRTESEAKS